MEIATDITERKLAEEALKEAHEKLERRVEERTTALNHSLEQRKRVSTALLWAEEKERERIAGELHDQVGQNLLLAKMKLDAVMEMSSSDKVQQRIENISGRLAIESSPGMGTTVTLTVPLGEE